ncbi:MAG: PAS domain S-box protein [Bacteroidales bacterium]
MKSRGLKVLLFEDDPLDIQLNINELKKENLKLETKYTAKEKEFKSLIENFNPDIILSDYNLPGFDGLDALNYVREKYPLIPIIIVTGSLDEETAASCIKKGAWDYVLKENIFRLNPAVNLALKHKAEKVKLKNIEDRIVESEAMSRKLINNIETGIILLDIDLKVVHVNKKALILMSLKSEDLIGKFLQKSIELQGTDPDISVDNSFFKKLKSIKETLHDKVLKYSSDKLSDYKYFNFCATPLFENNGALDQVLLCFNDITEKTLIENELKESKSRYEIIFNSVADGIFIYHPNDLYLIDVNNIVLQLYQYTKEEILELSIGELSDAENGYTNSLAKKYAQKALEGEEQVAEWRAKDKNGRCFWIHVTLKALTIGSQRVLMGIVRDIDSQKKTEYSLQKSQEHFRALTDNSPDVIMRFDRGHRHLFVNEAVKDLIGIEPSVFLNKSHREIGNFPEDLVIFWERNIEKIFSEKQSNTVEFSLDSEKGKIDIEWRLFPEFDDKNEVESVLAVARDVSENKLAEKRLRESEKRLQIALEGTSDGLWDWTISSDSIYFSPRYFTMLDYQPTDFNHDISVLPKLLHPDDKEWVLDKFESAIKEKNEGIEMEFRLRRKDGSYAWILSRGKITYKENGDAERMVGTHVDISLRKKHENVQNVLVEIANSVNNTRNLNELFQQIQKSLGNIIDTRNCYVALYDEKNDTISLPFHQDEKDTFTEFPAGKTVTGYVIKTGKAQLVDLKRVEELENSGEVEPIGAPSVSWLGVPLKIVDKIIGVFVVQSYSEEIQYTEDDVQLLEFVSDQIALAIERKIDQDKLKSNEIRQRRIIESSPDGLVVIDMNGRVVDYNSTFLELFRINDADCADKNFFDLIADRDVIRVQNILNETLKTSYSKNFEFKMKRANNTEFYTETSFGLIYGNKENEGNFVIVIKNIDERKVYEHNLRIAKEKAEESDRLKTAFLSNMSHEIRTPMNAIIGFSDLLSRAVVKRNEEKEEYVKQINFAADTLMRLIDDIIDISKIEAGQLKMNPSIFSLKSLFEEIGPMFHKSLEQQNKTHIDLVEKNYFPADDIQLHTDEFRLKQIFSNLLSNAIKFTTQGTISYGVKSVAKNEISFFVSDTGVGIEPGKQEYIFDRFRQGHENKEVFYGGTGLGLTISKNLVSLMGGELKVKSVMGEGSEFYFTLPYKETKLDIPDEVINIDRGSGNWSDKTFLIAEDDASNYFLLHENLKKFKVNILWAKTGIEAVETFKNSPNSIDLILMDVQMPEMNGYEATRLIKELNPEVPVIAQTAYAMAGEREASLKAGCDDYISKPLIMNELLFILNKYLDRKFVND